MKKYAIWIILGLLVAALVFIYYRLKNMENDNDMTVLSDERAKMNISTTAYGDAYNKMKVITPIEYMYRESGAKNPYRTLCKCGGACNKCKSKIGYSAQNLAKVDPRLVKVDKKGILYVDVPQMVALNTAAIKAMQEQMEMAKGITTPSRQSL